MTISYPLSLPTSIGIESIELRAVNAVATSQSPFTFRQQIVAHQGQRWEASVSVASGIRRDLAAPWKAFLTALKGQQGTFLLGDPDYATPRGEADTYGSATIGGLLLEDGDALLLEDGDALLYEIDAIQTLQVDGGSQTGETLAVKGAPGNITGYLLAGDYIQLGAGATATLHQVLQDADTDEFGDMTLDIWPGLRSSPADDATVTLFSPVGLFRLSSNLSSWAINNSSTYGIGFEAIEVI